MHRLRVARTTRQIIIAAIGVVSLHVVAQPAQATPLPSGPVDLLTEANVQIDGYASYDFTGNSVAPAGDINGDGRGDVIVGAQGASPNYLSTAGSAYVIFGQPTLTYVDLRSLGSRGFRINGANIDDDAGVSVAGAGDMTGDGRAEVVVGAWGADYGGLGSGSAYVVFGKADSSTVELGDLGAAGFRIDGAAAGDGAGISVSGVGDMSSDGRAEILVGARGASNESGEASGVAYLVFGTSDTAPITLAALGSHGFQIGGVNTGDWAGYSVAGLGDANGDGRAEILLGAPFADTANGADSGAAYVVFGKGDTWAVDLAALGSQGFQIDGPNLNTQAGTAVAGVEDMSRDHRAELIVGAPTVTSNGRDLSGSSYVIFGKQSTSRVDLASLGVAGFRIDGASRNDEAGSSVAGTGDLNGDGRPDVLVGSRLADNNSRTDSGSAWVIYGKQLTDPVDLAALSGRGFRVDGAHEADGAGYAVGGAGDFNGDGHADLLMGAPYADNNFRSDSGSAYILYGFKLGGPKKYIDMPPENNG